ncbi:MAG: Ppx/GppA family phosphatase [Candidatus Kapaibacterium sp.]
MNGLPINSELYKIAVIDIGTNTILMSTAIITKEKIDITGDYHKLARLGENVDKTGQINNEAIERSVKILLEYKDICAKENIQRIIVTGTSAMRDAANRGEVLSALGKSIGSEINIIDGKKEAELSFAGAARDSAPSLVIDVGGGSTEIISGREKVFSNMISLQIGAVRITERFFSSLPPGSDEYNTAGEYIRKEIRKTSGWHIDRKIYSVGGTATTIAHALSGKDIYDREAVHGQEVYYNDLSGLLDVFLSLTPDEITRKFGMHPKRADVISAGTLIMKELMEMYDKRSFAVSANGLRYGLLKQMQNNLFNKV